MPVKLKISSKQASNSALTTSLAVNGTQQPGPVSSFQSRTGALHAAQMDEDDFWMDDQLLETAPPVKKPKGSDFLKSIIKKSQRKAENVHHAKRDLERAVADDSEDEADLPITASQEVHERSCKQLEEKAAAFDGNNGIPAPAYIEQVLFPGKGEVFMPTIDKDFEKITQAVDSRINEPLTPAHVFEHVLMSGNLQALYFRSKAATEPIMRSLFECIYLHNDCVVADAAFQCLSDVFGALAHKSGLNSQELQNRKWVSPLHKARSSPKVDWSPAADDYKMALESCGLPILMPQRANREKGKTTQLPNTGQDVHPKTMATDVSQHRLKLLFRLLTIHSASKKGGFDENILSLVPSLLRLHLDPCISAIYQDLQVCVTALIGAVSDTKWNSSVECIASVIAGLGMSHRGVLHVLQQVPMHPRGADLQRLSAVMALQRVLGTSRAPAPKRVKKSSNKELNHVSKVLAHTVSLLGDAAQLAKTAQSASLSDEWNFWSIISTLQFADMVMWRSAKVASEDAEDSEALRRWVDFLQIMGRNVRTITQDESQNRAKLLISEISSYYDFMRRNTFV